MERYGLIRDGRYFINLSVGKIEIVESSELLSYADWFRAGTVRPSEQISIQKSELSEKIEKSKKPEFHHFLESAIWEISKEDYDSLLKEKSEMESKKAATAAERKKVLLSVEIPATAKKAYADYHGNDERAWECEDEQAWALIRKYRSAIEIQMEVSRG